ncbi:MAG: HAMP domain-containing histidine kinase [Lachnospiraceae bacterium]|nr:HAMP domain-containing histidine kinase [Lachnospiraceae bacterium]
MKSFYGIFTAMLLMFVLIFVVINTFFFHITENRGKAYRVEAERAAWQIQENGMENLDLSHFPMIYQIKQLDTFSSEKEKAEFFEGEAYDYLVKNINGIYYRFDYIADNSQKKTISLVNVIVLVIAVFMIAVLQFFRIRLLKPFYQLREVPFELSKGNLTIPLKEHKSHFFGRFIWGMDLLRENLEQKKEMELKLQKEKKTLILSISHDIKTPLSAIKLYAKALEKNLYDNPEKQREIAGRINKKADDIEAFVSQVISACNEDFLNFTVQKGEFYLSQAIEQILKYYTEKLELLKTDFKVSDYRDCILKGDLDRIVEVLQNIMENAIKYGDGHSVVITFSSEEDCQLITVSNSGCTLGDTELVHIFESFWRGSNALKCRGSGLGLYICRQLMNKMGGEVFAECQEGEMKVTVVILRA